MTAAFSAWSGRSLRIDPKSLPARYDVSAPAEASVYLDRRGVVVKRRLSGLPLTLSLPIEVYEGIAVRVEPEGAFGLVATVELLHRDPGLSVPLAVTRDMEEAAGDWHAWSETLKLPLILIEADGALTKVPTATAIPLDCPAPRRRTGLLANRRPRFLVRRQTGRRGPMPVLSGWREIIAPE